MMDSTVGIHMEPLHKRPDLMDACIDLLNAQWPRSKAARLHSLDKSCDGLPYSLVMVDDKCEISSDPSAVIGYCRLAKIISVPSSVLIESVVVPKNLRGQGLGRQLMELAETHAKMQGFTTMYLSTKDKQDFYAHLGYEFCKAVNTLDAQILETCDLWQVACDSTSLSHVSCSSESECPSRDEHPCAGRRQVSRLDGGCPKAVEDSSDDSCSKPSPDSKTSGSLPMSQSGDGAPCETNLSIPPPPPPPPVRVPETPPMVVYWMKKEVS